MTRAALDPSQIRILNWNIAKGSRRGWRSDLNTLASGRDLVMIQEARLEHGMQHALGERSRWEFAPGFGRPNLTTGVLTISGAHAVRRDTHRHPEPLFRTSKAALVTEYRLAEREETLLVVNIHSINFTLGTHFFRRQLQAVCRSIHGHAGPAIFSGDFNTWRPARQRIVDDGLRDSGLTPLAFEQDRRKRAFGRPLDHIYMRGLVAEDSGVQRVGSSDHNPMTATLSAR
ncbi:MAG: endonuclease/exonuclease/phosphatase (EEP) superfamily protein YafD [Myxococcota bacterium]|jgi:endonuclease/exonuclease/phosphatase (EEP) superfamily protein YafD